MPKASRDKGLLGEREVRAVWESHGFTVRGLEGEGDHLISAGANLIEARHKNLPFRATLHEEVKRCETARPWVWRAQAVAEAPPIAVPIVTFRRNRSEWLTLIATDDLARLLA